MNLRERKGSGSVGVEPGSLGEIDDVRKYSPLIGQSGEQHPGGPIG